MSAADIVSIIGAVGSAAALVVAAIYTGKAKAHAGNARVSASFARDAQNKAEHAVFTSAMAANNPPPAPPAVPPGDVL